MKIAHPKSKFAVEFMRKKIQESGITQQRAAEIMGVKQPSVSNYLKGKINLSPASVNRIIKHYPDAYEYIYNNPDDRLEEAREVPLQSNTGWRLIPFIHAYASLPESWDQETMRNYPNTFITNLQDDGLYCAFEARSDSMEEPQSDQSIPEGSILICRELQMHHWRDKLHLHKVFVIIHREKGWMIKQITAHDIEQGIITCHSYNSIYPDLLLSLNDVQKLFYLKQLVVSRDR